MSIITCISVLAFLFILSLIASMKLIAIVTLVAIIVFRIVMEYYSTRTNKLIQMALYRLYYLNNLMRSYHKIVLYTILYMNIMWIASLVLVWPCTNSFIYIDGFVGLYCRILFCKNHRIDIFLKIGLMKLYASHYSSPWDFRASPTL